MSNFIQTTPTLNLPFNRQKTPEDMNSLLKRVGATYTRGGDSGSATYVNSKGLIEVVPDGLPRPDFDPVTKQNKGLLVEESRENLVQSSEDLSSWWNVSSATISSNVEDSIIKDVSADKLIPDNGVDTSGGESSFTSGSINKGINLGASVIGSFSFFAKASGYNEGCIRDGRTGDQARFTLTGDGTISDRGDITNTKITSLGLGWYKISCNTSADYNNASSSFGIKAGNGVCNGVDGLLIIGIQHEEGSFPTSYIPTAGSSVTRGADNCYIDGTAFTDFYNQNEGTFVVEIVGELERIGGIMAVHRTVNDAAGRSFSQIKSGGDNSIDGAMGGDYINLAEPDEFSFIDNTIKTAFKGNQSGYDYFVNGVKTDTGGKILSPNTGALWIGSWTSGGSKLNGHIKRLLYFPVALIALEQIKLTRNL